MSRFLHSRLASLEAYTPGEQPRSAGLIKLNTNESPFPPAPGTEEAVRAAAQGLRLYSDLAAGRLKALLSADTGVPEGQIALGNGSDELLAFAFQAFGEHGLLFPDVTYGFYQVWAELYGLRWDTVPLREDLSLDTAPYRGSGRMTVIANPNAPTGMAVPPEEIAAIAASDPDRVVLVDEAYVDFGGETCVPLLQKFDNLLIVRTFSKSRQLAGGRLGYAMGSHALIYDLERIRYSFNPYNVNSLTQAAGAASLEDREYFRRCRAEVIAAREWTAGQLAGLGMRVLPSRANFLFAAPRCMSGREYWQALRERDILVRFFDQPRTRDFVRITIGTRAQMERLVAVTKELFA